MRTSSLVFLSGLLLPVGCTKPPVFSGVTNVAQSPTSTRPVQFVSATAFGAKCDGSTDDSGAISAALQTGQPVQLPIGTCAVGSAIFFGGGQLEGSSATGTVLKWIGSEPPMPSSVSNSIVTGGVATVNTTTPHGLWPHETVVVEGNSNAVLDGVFIVQSIPSATSFTYALPSPDSSGSGGSAGMYYLLDSSKLPNGTPPLFLGANAGWVSNLTIDCNSTPGVSGLLQLGDSGSAENLFIQNCVDGYTGVQTYMSPATHVTVNNSTSQGVFLKNTGANNGAATGGTVWANGFGKYGIHLRGTIGKFDQMYAQAGRPGSIYPFYFEGDGPGVTRSGTLQCSSCVADGAAGINSFYIRRYYVQLESPQVATTAPSQDVFVFDDAWGMVNNAIVYPQVAPGYFTFRSLGNSAGLTGAIILMGGGGTIDPVGASDFSVYGFSSGSNSITTSIPDGSANAPAYSFMNDPGLGWYRAEAGVMALGSEGQPVLAVSPGGVSALKSFNLCVNPIVGPCYGGISVNGPDELVTLDHNGTWGGGDFTARILKLGINSNDTGISRLAPGRFAFGNGTNGDVSGVIYSNAVVVQGTEAPPGAIACFKVDKSLGFCSTPMTGTPPTCTCK